MRACDPIWVCVSFEGTPFDVLPEHPINLLTRQAQEYFGREMPIPLHATQPTGHGYLSIQGVGTEDSLGYDICTAACTCTILGCLSPELTLSGAVDGCSVVWGLPGPTQWCLTQG